MAQVHKCDLAEAPEYKVFIATPSIDGATAPAYTVSLLRTIEVARKQKIGIVWYMLAYNCHVDDSRNSLVREFLKSDCDCLFFIDADVGWQEQDFIKSVQSEKQVVGGIYPKKSDSDERWPVRLLPGELWTDDDGWLEIKGIPTGFMRLKREAVQALYDAEPKKHSKSKDEGQLKQAIIFERVFQDGNRIGGDFAMCDKWLELGGKIYTDPDMRFSHTGYKQWEGNFSYHLREKHGLLEEQVFEILSNIEEGNYDEEAIVALDEAWTNTTYSLNPATLYFIAWLIEQGQYESILDLGSGLSTLVLSALSKRKGFYVESVEQDKFWLGVVHQYLNKMENSVRLVYAPIKNDWYDYYPDKNFDLVICDGPNRKNEVQGIRANITRIKNCFTSDCTIVIDDYKPYIENALGEFTFYQRESVAIGVKQ